MLKGITSILPPDLVKILMEMGYGDEIDISDANSSQPVMRAGWLY